MRRIARWYSILAFACVAGAHAQEQLTTGARTLQAGQSFSDALNSGGQGPEMVVIPAGPFRMGCVSGMDCLEDEMPVRDVTIPQPFAVSKYEVTFEDWDRCVAGGGCGGYRAGDEGWGRGRRPVINVSWNDAQAYVAWLSDQSRRTYRLLSEAEWEYVTRAGSSTSYGWGSIIGTDRANCDGCGSRWDDSQTAPVGSFQANAFGVHDMHGNVREWVEDCWNDTYAGAPTNGSAWESGDCDLRMLRGGSWYSDLSDLRSASRGETPSMARGAVLGIRVARTLRQDQLQDTEVPGPIQHADVPPAFLDSIVLFDAGSARFFEISTGTASEASVREVIEDFDSYEVATCLWADIGLTQFRSDCMVEGVQGIRVAQFHFEWDPDFNVAQLTVRAGTSSTTAIVPYISMTMMLPRPDTGE